MRRVGGREIRRRRSRRISASCGVRTGLCKHLPGSSRRRNASPLGTRHQSRTAVPRPLEPIATIEDAGIILFRRFCLQQFFNFTHHRLHHTMPSTTTHVFYNIEPLPSQAEVLSFCGISVMVACEGRARRPHTVARERVPPAWLGIVLDGGRGGCEASALQRRADATSASLPLGIVLDGGRGGCGASAFQRRADATSASLPLGIVLDGARGGCEASALQRRGGRDKRVPPVGHCVRRREGRL